MMLREPFSACPLTAASMARLPLCMIHRYCSASRLENVISFSLTIGEDIPSMALVRLRHKGLSVSRRMPQPRMKDFLETSTTCCWKHLLSSNNGTRQKSGSAPRSSILFEIGVYIPVIAEKSFVLRERMICAICTCY